MSRRTAANASKYSCASDDSLHEKERRAHPEQDRFEQADIFFDDDLVDHHFGEDREEQFEESDRDREQQDLQQNRAEFREERHEPGQRSVCFRALAQTRSCNRRARRNPTSSARIPCAEFCASPSAGSATRT